MPILQRKTAFSLIEILVVVATVTILAALAVPALGGMTARMTETRALNHLRGLGLAVRLYAAENNGDFPQSSHQNNSWVSGLAPYVEVDLNQPSKALQRAMRKAYRSPGDSHKTRLYSYALNDFLTPSPAGGGGLDYSKAQKLSHPSATILMAETQATFTGSDHFHFVLYGVTEGNVRGSIAVDRYRGKGLYLFADCHVETLAWDDLRARLSTSKIINPQNPN